MAPEDLKLPSDITWQRLAREDSVTYPCDAPDKPGNEIIFGEGFPTSSGRGRMRAVDLTPPDETPDDDFPMILTTGRQLEHWHTGAITRRSSVLDTLEPEAVASMNPRELKLRGWRPGDRTRVAKLFSIHSGRRRRFLTRRFTWASHL
jgi:formate dehydrogenase major subunit